MLYYNRIDVYEGTYINKKSASKEYDICHYWYFLDKWFQFQSQVCNGCHDVLMMFVNLSDIAILNINGVDYCCIITGISKSEAVNLLQKADLNEKNVNFFFVFYIYTYLKIDFLYFIMLRKTYQKPMLSKHQKL